MLVEPVTIAPVLTGGVNYRAERLYRSLAKRWELYERASRVMVKIQDTFLTYWVWIYFRYPPYVSVFTAELARNYIRSIISRKERISLRRLTPYRQRARNFSHEIGIGMRDRARVGIIEIAVQVSPRERSIFIRFPASMRDRGIIGTSEPARKEGPESFADRIRGTRASQAPKSAARSTEGPAGRRIIPLVARAVRSHVRRRIVVVCPVGRPAGRSARDGNRSKSLPITTTLRD